MMGDYRKTICPVTDKPCEAACRFWFVPSTNGSGYTTWWLRKKTRHRKNDSAFSSRIGWRRKNCETRSDTRIGQDWPDVHAQKKGRVSGRKARPEFGTCYKFRRGGLQ